MTKSLLKWTTPLVKSGQVNLYTLECLVSNFSLHYHPWIEHTGYENKGNDHQFKKLLILKNNSCQYHRECEENSMENMNAQGGEGKG